MRVSHGGLRWVIGPLLAAGLALGAFPSAARTSEVGEGDGAAQEAGEVGESENDGSEESAGDLVLSPQVLPVHPKAVFQGASGLIVWSGGRRAYQLLTTDALAVYDLDTFQQTAEVPLGRIPVTNTAIKAIAPYYPVDDAGGRLFVPYTEPSSVEGLADLANPSCLGPPASALDRNSCLRGVLVLDAVTLAVRADVPFSAAGLDGGSSVVAPRLNAMAYSPRGATGRGDKLHVLVDEGAESTAPGVQNSVLQQSTGQTYLGQIDLETGVTDWLVRVPACVYTTFNAEEHPRRAVYRRLDASSSPSISIGCQASGGSGVLVRVSLDPANVDASPLAQLVVPGPPQVKSILADPVGDRMLFRSAPSGGDSWWVYDGTRRAFIGAIGVGAKELQSGGVVDPGSGRFYTVAPPRGQFPQEGLFVADARRTPLPQALPFPEFGQLLAANNPRFQQFPLAIDSAGHDRPARLLLRPGSATGLGAKAPDHYVVIEDSRAVTTDSDGAGLSAIVPSSDDVPVTDGTLSAFTTAGRGYGLRSILIGGIEAMYSPASPDVRHVKEQQTEQDPLGIVDDNAESPGFRNLDALDSAVGTVFGLLHEPPPPAVGAAARETYPGLEGAGPSGGDPCATNDRDLIFGLTGALGFPADLRPSSSSAQAIAALMDPQTDFDLSAPADRCASGPLAALQRMVEGNGLRPPTAVNDGLIALTQETASCVAPGDTTTDGHEGDVTPVSRFVAEVTCEAGAHTTSHGAASLLSVGPLTVGHASSTMDLTFENGTAVVARAYAVARGIDIGGLVQIDAVQATATVWASGRSQPGGVDPADRNCNATLTAGTCYQRTISGLTAGDFHCDQCVLTNDQFAQVIQQALGSGWSVNLREPDRFLAGGADNGALAAIQKESVELFADAKLKNDQLATIPALELVRVNDSPGVGRGRQIYQFAGVELASVFSIQCQLQIIEDECRREPGALTIGLQDIAEVPLAGGVFELYADADAGDGSGDGIIDPLTDVLIDQGTCATAVDGVGTCRFEELEPGDYVIREAAAPIGYIAANDFAVTVGEGADLTVTFTNASSVGAITLSLVDDGGASLSGGTFQLFVDDGDGVLTEQSVMGPQSSADQYVASCTTDVFGGCGFDPVLLGPTGERAFIVHQSGAPDDFAPSPDATLTLRSGELFTLTFTNVKNIGGRIVVSLVDDVTSAPLADAVFDVYADDGNAALDDGDVLYASCVTDSSGSCRFVSLTAAAAAIGGPLRVVDDGATLSVPVDAYLVRQSSAPQGYEPAADVGFAFTARGQQADVVFRNALIGAGQDEESSEGDPPPDTATGTADDGADVGAPDEIVDDQSDDQSGDTDVAPPDGLQDAPLPPPDNGSSAGSTPLAFGDPVTSTSFVPLPVMTGPTTFAVPVAAPVVAPTATLAAAVPAPAIVQVLQVPRQLARLVAREPRQAAAFGALILLAAGAAAVTRRRLLLVALLG